MQINIINIVVMSALFLSPSIGTSGENRAMVNSPVAQPTADEKYILNRGEMSTTRYLGGALFGSVFGLGSGHFIQGRFLNKGMYFLFGEAAGASTVLIGGIALCGIQGGKDSSNCQLIQNIGVGIFVAAKAWEIFDLWVIPPIENSEYRELIKKYPDKKRVAFQPFIFPTSSSSMVAGLAMSF